MTRAEWLKSLKPGDSVTRVLGDVIPMKLTVGEVTDTKIILLGGWEFLIETGQEVDELLGWDGKNVSGSFLQDPFDAENGNQD